MDERPEVELRNYLGVLRHRIPVILLVTVLAVGVALAFDFTTTRIYSASADVLLTQAQQESVFANSPAAQPDPVRQLDTQVAVMQSSTVEHEVNRQLGPASGQVTNVSVSGVGQTDLLRVTVQSPSPAIAQRAANTYANTYVANRRGQAVDSLLAAGKEVQKKADQIQAQLNTLDAQIAQAKDPVQVAQLRAQRDSLAAQNDLFRQKLDQVQVDTALKTGGAQLVASADMPTSPVRPKPIRDGSVALGLGLLLGVGLAFLAEYLDDKINHPADVPRYGRGVTVLGEIPAVPSWRNRKATRVAALDDPSSMGAETYRSLRTSIQIIGLRHPLQTLLVTSPTIGDGKTTTVVNLGVTLARAGRRIVLVDMDLRRPRLEKFFGLPGEIGITSVLAGDTPLSQALQEVPVAPDLPPVKVLAAGPPPSNPAELVGVDRVGELLAALQTIADLVIIDSPPLIPVTDALVLSGRVDGVVLVVGAGITRRKSLTHAVELLQQAEAPVLGAVLNATNPRRRHYAYGLGYGYGYKANGGSAAKKGRAASRS